MKTIISILSLILISQSFGSIFSKKPDLIITDNDEEVIWEYPLEDYLKYFCNVDALIKFDSDFCGEDKPYLQCKWKIENEKLYLCSVTLPKGEYPLNKLFPEQSEKVHATWYSGLISYAHGRLIGHDQYGDSLILENWTVYHISQGTITKRTTINIPERSLSYSKALLENIYPLSKDNCPLLYEGPKKRKRNMTIFLSEAFSRCKVDRKSISYTYPNDITIKISANLDDFEFEYSHRKLSAYKLLKVVAEETETELDIHFHHTGDVIYEIKESEPVK